jgi:hypothetical protein
MIGPVFEGARKLQTTAKQATEKKPVSRVKYNPLTTRGNQKGVTVDDGTFYPWTEKRLPTRKEIADLQKYHDENRSDIVKPSESIPAETRYGPEQLRTGKDIQLEKDIEDFARRGMAKGRLATSARLKDEKKYGVPFEERARGIEATMSGESDPERLDQIRARMEGIQLDKRSFSEQMVESANQLMAQAAEAVQPVAGPVGRALGWSQYIPAKLLGVDAPDFGEKVLPGAIAGLATLPVQAIAELGVLVDPDAPAENKVRAGANLILQIVPVERIASGGIKSALQSMKLSREQAEIIAQIERQVGFDEIERALGNKGPQVENTGRKPLQTKINKRDPLSPASQAAGDSKVFTPGQVKGPKMDLTPVDRGVKPEIELTPGAQFEAANPKAAGARGPRGGIGGAKAANNPPRRRLQTTVAPKQEPTVQTSQPSPGTKAYFQQQAGGVAENPGVQKASPRTEPTRTEPARTEGEFSPKHADTEALRQEFGLPERSKSGRTWQEAAEEAERQGLIGSAESVAKEVIAKPRPLSDAETIGLGIKGQRIAAQVRETEQAINSAIESGAPKSQVDTLRQNLARQQSDLFDIAEAIDIGGTETGRGLNARRVLLQGQYDELGLTLRAQASKGERLASDDLTKITEQATKIQELEKRLAALEGGSKSSAKPRERRIVSEERYAQAKKDLMSSLNTGITADQFKAFKDIALYHLESGIIKVEEVAAKIREVIPQHRQKDVSDHDIARAIREAQGTYGRSVNTGRAYGEDVRIQGNVGIKSKEIEDLRYQLDVEKNRADGLIDALRPRTAVEKGKDVINSVRSIMTSLDISAPGRQGLALGISNPTKVPKAFANQLRAFGSEKEAYKIARAIEERANAKLYRSSGLYLAPVDNLTRLSAREENFMANLAAKLPGVKASERAYATYLNQLRADVFDTMAEALAKGGKLDDESAAAIANYINIATGRGDLGKLAPAAETLNTIFFAPRYAASRFQFLLGQPLMKGNVAANKLIAKEYAKFLVGTGTLLALGHLAGGKLEGDPRSSDFGKIRFGDTRIDVGGGLNQSATFLARMVTGQTKTGDQIKKQSRQHTAVRFVRSKAAPVVGAGWSIAEGKDYIGQPVSTWSVLKGFLPMTGRELYEALQEEGLEASDTVKLLNLLGVPVSEYRAKGAQSKD